MKKIDNFSNYGITSCGKVWSYINNKFIKAYKSKGYWFYQIRCVELNLDFPSQTAAAEYMGCCHQNISNCLRGKTKTACGYHWEVI